MAKKKEEIVEEIKVEEVVEIETTLEEEIFVGLEEDDTFEEGEKTCEA